MRYTGCGPIALSTGPAIRNATTRPKESTASNAAIVRLRTASGVRRCMMLFSETIVSPSHVPIASSDTNTSGKTGANPTPNAAIDTPNAPTTSQTASVLGFIQRPVAEPITEPVPQQAISNANPTGPTENDSARAASA